MNDHIDDANKMVPTEKLINYLRAFAYDEEYDGISNTLAAAANLIEQQAATIAKLEAYANTGKPMGPPVATREEAEGGR